MKKKLRIAASLMLVVVFLLSIVPLSAFAAAESAADVVEQSGEEQIDEQTGGEQTDGEELGGDQTTGEQGDLDGEDAEPGENGNPPQPESYNVLFLAEDGSLIGSSVSIKEGDKLDSTQIPAAPAKKSQVVEAEEEGLAYTHSWTFDGWAYTDASGNPQKISSEDLPGLAIDKSYDFIASYAEVVDTAPIDETEPAVFDITFEFYNVMSEGPVYTAVLQSDKVAADFAAAAANADPLAGLDEETAAVLATVEFDGWSTQQGDFDVSTYAAATSDATVALYPVATNMATSFAMDTLDEVAAPEGVQLFPGTTMVSTGASVTLNAVLTPVGAGLPEGYTIEYTADNANATVSGDGTLAVTVTGVAAGKTYVTVTVKNGSSVVATAKSLVTVKDVTVNLTHYSNYPDGAQILVYNNNVTSTVRTVRASDATAVVSAHAAGTSAAAGQGLSLVSHTFTGWNTKADGSGTAYAVGDSVLMESNVDLYAQWDKTATGKKIDLKVTYRVRNSSGRIVNVEKTTDAVLVEGGNPATVSFLVSSLEDVGSGQYIDPGRHDFSGWEINGSSCTSLTLVTVKAARSGQYWNYKYNVTVSARYDRARGEAYPATFYIKRMDANGNLVGDWLDAGIGTLHSSINDVVPTDSKAGTLITDNVSQYIESEPDRNAMATILGITVSEAETITWIEINNAWDGYHVNGTIVDAGFNHRVRFYDGDNLIYDSYHARGEHISGAVFDELLDQTDGATGWTYNNEAIGSISNISKDYDIYAKHPDKFTVVGRFDDSDTGVVVPAGAQNIVSGKKSAPITFTCNPGYVIEKVVVQKAGQRDETITQGVAGKTAYTYGEQTVKGNITVTVYTRALDQYTVTWKDEGDDGTVHYTQHLYENELVEEYRYGGTPPNGYEFAGWTPEPDSYVGKTTNRDLVFTARYERARVNIDTGSLTLDLGDAEKVYSSVDPTYTIDNVTGWPQGAEPAHFNAVFSRSEGEDVGGYTYKAEITVKQDYAHLYNLTGNDPTAPFAITKLGVTVTPADSGKTYGEDDPDPLAGTAAIVFDTVENQKFTPEEPDYDLERDLGEGVAAYELRAIAIGGKEGVDPYPNYDIDYGTSKFVITAKKVTLTASSLVDQTFTGQVYTQADFTAEPQIWLADGDTFDGLAAYGEQQAPGESPVTFKVAANSTAIMLAEAGGEPFALTLGGTDAAPTLTGSDNYEFTLVPGVVSVLVPGEGGTDKLTWSLSGDDMLETPYDGTEQTNETLRVTYGLGLSDGQGAFSHSGISALAQRRDVYDADQPSLSAAPDVSEQEFSYGGRVFTYWDNAGVEHDATAWFADEPAATDPGKLSIKPATVNVSLDIAPTSLKVGDTAPTAGVAYNTWVAADAAKALTDLLYAQPGIDNDYQDVPGDYTYSLSGEPKALHGNYSFTYGGVAAGAVEGADVEVHMRETGSLVYDNNGVASAAVPQGSGGYDYLDNPSADVVTGDITPDGSIWRFTGWSQTAAAAAPDPGLGVGAENATVAFTTAGQTITLYAVWQLDEETARAKLGFTGYDRPYDGKAQGAAWTTEPSALGAASVAYTGDDGAAAPSNPAYKDVKWSDDENRGAVAYGVAATVDFTNPGNGGAESVSVDAELLIRPLALTYKVKDQTVVFGSAAEAFTLEGPDGLLPGENAADVVAVPPAEAMTCDTDYAAGSPVDTYPVTYTGAALTANNYDVTVNGGGITVVPLTFNKGDGSDGDETKYLGTYVELTDDDKVYGGDEPTSFDSLFAWNTLPEEWADLFTVSVSRAEGEDVGEYTITAEIGLTAAAAASGNYALEGDDPTSIFTITPATLTVAAEDLTVPYGKDVPALTYTLGGLTNGDEAGDIEFTTLPSLSHSYADGDAGAYDITVDSTGSIANNSNGLKNYTLEGANAILTILPVRVDLAGEEDLTDETGTEEDGVYVYRLRVAVADTYKLYAQFDPASFGYAEGSDAYLKGILGEKAYAEVTWEDVQRTEGGEDVNGGHLYTLEGALTGTDNVQISGSVIPGGMEIRRLTVTILPDELSKNADGDDPALTATETFTPERQINTPADVIYRVEREAGEDVGTYRLSVVPTLEGETLDSQNPNYAITVGSREGGDFFEITPEGVLTISMPPSTKVYGDGDPDLTGLLKVNGLERGDTIESLGIKATRVAGETVGTYTVNVTWDENDTYEEIRLQSVGSFTITQRPVTLIANSYETDEGEDIPAFGYYVSRNAGRGLASWDSALILSLYQSPAGTAAGTYGVLFNIPENRGVNANYKITVVGGTLTINAAGGPGTTDPGTTDPGTPGPATPAGVVPGGPAAVVAVPPAPPADDADAPEPVELEPEETPLTEPAVTVDDLEGDEVPLAQHTASWALLNLLVAILTLAFAVLLFATMFKCSKKRSEDEEEARNRRSGLLWRAISILAGVLAPIMFLLTEDMSGPMAFVDRWTMLMAIILVVQVFGMLLMRHAHSKED